MGGGGVGRLRKLAKDSVSSDRTPPPFPLFSCGGSFLFVKRLTNLVKAFSVLEMQLSRKYFWRCKIWFDSNCILGCNALVVWQTKQSLYRPRGFQKVEASRISIQSAMWRCCEPYGSAAFTRRKYSWYSFLLEAESTTVIYCERKDYVNEKFQFHHRESNPRPSGSTNCVATVPCLVDEVVPP